MSRHSVTDAEYATALEAGRRAVGSEFRAEAVSYLADRDAIEVITVRNGGFVIPRHLVGLLQDVAPADLAGMEVWPDGSIIEIESLDIHISVDAMVKAALPVLVPARIVAGMSAPQGGMAQSEAKASVSRKSGKKGGRSKEVA